MLLPAELIPVPKALITRGELMLGWPGWEPTREMFMYMDFDRAQTLEEFTTALKIQEVGMQNWQAATADGHVYATHGQIPDRGPVESRPAANQIMDASDPSTLWTGEYLPPEQLPALDGSQPFLTTANNDPWGHTADGDPLNDPFYYGSFYAPGYRAAYLVDELGRMTEQGGITREQMQQLQLDQRSLVAPRVLPRLAEAVGRIETDEALAPWRDRVMELTAALEQLEQWDQVMGTDSEPALLFRLWMAYTSRSLLEDTIGELLFSPIDDAQPVTVIKMAALLIEREPEALVGEDLDEVLVGALADALDTLAARGIQTWGEQHFARFISPDGIAEFEPIGGGDTSVNVAQSRCWQDEIIAARCITTSGAVFRTVTTFDEQGTPQTWFNWPEGNGPGTQDWLDGTYRRWRFERAEIEQDAQETRTLE